MRRNALLFFLVLAPLACSKHKPSHADIMGAPVLDKSDDELAQTEFTAYLNHPITPGKNLIWCATMPLTWNELVDLAGGTIHLVGGDPPIVTELNRKTVTRSDLDDSSYVAIAGLAPGVLESIQKAVDLKFKGQASPEFLGQIASDLGPGDAVAYSYLFKNLEFEHRFEKNMPLNFARSKITAFGFSSHHEKQKDAAAQVSIYDYRSNNDFVVEIRTKSSEDRLVIAKVPPDSTLSRTVQMVRARLDSTARTVEDGTPLEVPVLNFRLIKDYQELVGQHIQSPNPALNGQLIAMAKQLIRFRLDETGAKLKSEAVIPITKSADIVDASIPELIFDKPFLILMEREGAANPYFALWVDNPELLIPFVPEKPER